MPTAAVLFTDPLPGKWLLWRIKRGEGRRTWRHNERGHTPQRAVFFDLPYKVGIDTGLVYGGKLTCLEWTEKILYQVAKGSRKVTITDVANRWFAAGLLNHSL